MSKAKPWHVFQTTDGTAHLLKEDEDFGVLSHASFHMLGLAERVVALLNEYGDGRDRTE